MADCSPQRFLAGNRNAVLTAALTPSSVLPVENSVKPIPTARDGSAQVKLTGPYSGALPATYDIGILDDDVETSRTSAPVFTGEGAGGSLANIVTDLPAQEITAELSESGLPLLFAQVDFDGATIKARQGGAGGNSIYFDVDQSPLVFTPQSFSLLNDLEIGAGGKDAPLEGAEYDYDTAVLGADNSIPTSAHRISFGDDRAHVYVQYKTYLDGKWEYFFVPELKRPVAKGTVVNFVTGSRTVRVYPGSPPETYTGIVTLYDLLVALQTSSQLVIVDGVVANDRSPTGQAARDLQTRTDAYAEANPGSGSAAATSSTFEDVSVNQDAGTQLVVATCRAVGPADHPLAGVGRERWDLRSSILGALGTLVTGDLFSGSDFSLRIPPRLPFAQSTQVGKFMVTDITYASRADTDPTPPPICPAVGQQAGLLGPNAVDQTLTLVYTARPTGNCDCSGLPTEDLDTACLGNEAITESEGSMSYGAANNARLVSLYDWLRDTARANSSYELGSNGLLQVPQQAPFVAAPLSPSTSYMDLRPLKTIVANFESALAEIDALAASAIKTAGEDAWDSAVAEMKADVDEYSRNHQTLNLPSYENLTDGMHVGVFKDEDGTRKVRKAITGCERYGFVLASVTAPATVDVYFYGLNKGVTGLTPGTTYSGKVDGTGGWVTPVVSIQGQIWGTAFAATELNLLTNSTWSHGYFAVLADRYATALNWALISAGISPLGKADGSTVISGDGCYRDWGDAYYWVITGSEAGGYPPAFTNHPYWSVRRGADDGAYYASKEFAFQVNVVPACIADLRVGDTITMSINGAVRPSTYQVGDELPLRIVGASNLYLAGGQDESLVQAWLINGSVSGPFPPYPFDPDAPAPYSTGSPSVLSLTLSQGPIPYAKGDRWAFTIEGGHWRYRVNGGAWVVSSPPEPIPNGVNAFESGLSIEFVPGAAPSFVAGDVFSFKVFQPWAVSNVRTPSVELWRWNEPDPTLVIDSGAPVSSDLFAIALHTIPEGATIVLEGGDAPGIYDWSEPVTWHEGLIVHPHDETRVCRYRRLSLTDAAGGGIGWIWTGMALSTSKSADYTPRSEYSFARSEGGANRSGIFLGKGRGADVSWKLLLEDDMAGIKALLDWVKKNDDEWLVFLGQITRPDEAMLVQVLQDQIDEHDTHDGNKNVEIARQFDVALTLGAVLQ